MTWENAGAATYDRWEVSFALVDAGGATEHRSTSSFLPRLFLPGTRTVTDSFTLPGSVPAGTYDLVVVVKDPPGYREPMPLFLTSRRADGSYLLARRRAGAVSSPRASG